MPANYIGKWAAIPAQGIEFRHAATLCIRSKGLAIKSYPALRRGAVLPLRSVISCLGEGLIMPKGPKGEKRPADAVGAAISGPCGGLEVAGMPE